MIDHSTLTEEWLRDIVPKYNLPASLRPHQKDAMSLLKQGRHVFLGRIKIYKIYDELTKERFKKNSGKFQEGSRQPPPPLGGKKFIG